MKNSKVTLMEFDKASGPTEHYDIPWPKVQKELGVDHVDWLYKQPVDKCQMILELSPNGCMKLVAEFYDKELSKTYHLMWAR